MIDVKAEIDGHYLADYQGDGLIVATPTGSTGYNLSTGGPILEPQLPVWVLSPVAPHSLNMRPLVVSAASCLHLVVNSRSSHVLLSMDGRSVSIPSGTSLTITAAPFSMPVVRPSGSIFATTLREKLYWGLVSGR